MAAERKIETTLAIGGEKVFNAAIADSARSLKIMASELKLNTAEFNLNGSSIDNLTKRRGILSREMDQEREHIQALTQAVMDSTQRYGESHANTDKYRESLVKSQTALTAMEKELEDNQQEINQFGKEIKDADKKTIDWHGTLQKVGDVLGKGLSVAAKTTGIAMAAIGTAAVAAGKQIFDLASSTGTYADDLLTLSAQTGISTTSLQEWQYAAQFIDTEVETMTGSMAKMIRQMTSAKEGTGASAEAFAALGVGITDSSGKMLDSEAVFFAAIDSLGKVANETERDALAMQLFGKSAQELNPLILAGSDQLRALGVEAQNAGLIMSGEALNSFGAFDDTMNRVKSTVTAVGHNLASIFLPAIQAAATGAQEMLATINTSLADGFQPEDIEVIGKKIAEKLSDGMQKITEYLPQVISTVTSVLDKLIKFAVTYLPTLLPMLMDAAVKLLQGAIKAITDNISKISEMVTTLIKSFVKFIVDNLPAVIKVAIEIILALIDGLVQAIPDLVAALPEIITTIVDGVIGAVPKMLEIGADLVRGLWDGIKSMITWLGDKVGGWISGVWKDIKSFFGISSPSKLMANTIGKPMVQGVAQGILDNAGLVNDAMRDLMPDTSLVMDVTRRFNDVGGGSLSAYNNLTATLGDTALDRLADRIVAALQANEAVIMLNDREMGRYVRKAALA